MNLEQAQTAMQIILHAGDARVKAMEALNALEKFDISEARKALALAKEEVVEAHKIQTTALHAESNGEEVEYSILFTHAQDTCMSVDSEINMIEHMIALFESIDNRFKKLEN